MTDLPPTTPPPAGTQTPRTQAVIDAFADSGCKDMQPVFDFARQLERELAVVIKERDENKAYINSRVLVGFGDGCFAAVDPWAKVRIENMLTELAALRQQLELSRGREDQLASVRAHGVERAEAYCRLHDQLAATRKELEEARGALEVERGWVKSLAKDNGILLQAADATKQGSVCVSQAGRIEFLEEQLAKCTVSVLPKGHMQLSHRLYLRAYQVLCQARVMFEASLILQDDRDNMKAIRVMSDSAKAVLDELPNPVTPPLKGETKPAE